MSDATLRDRLVSFFRFSIADCVAICMGIALLLLTLIAWAIFDSEPQRVAWGDYVQWPQMLSLGLLWGLICCLSYWTVRLWNEDLPARDRELEIAWKAGMTALRKRGVAIDELPLFLVLGCQDEKSQSSFLQHAGIQMSIEPIPVASAAPLRWYIAQDRILLFCGDVGTFGATQNRFALHRQDELATSDLIEMVQLQKVPLKEIEANASSRNQQQLQRQDSITFLAMAPHAMVGPSAESTGSDFLNFVATLDSEERSSATKPSPRSSDQQVLESLEATERLFSDLDREPTDSANIADEEPQQPIHPKQQHFSVLSSKEIVRLQSLLEDTCKRLKVARGKSAPVNGIVAWIDGPQLMDCARFSRQCGQAFRRDSLQIQQHLGLLAPVTVVVDRMHELVGFTELIRRMGREKSSRDALGEAFELQRLPEWPAIRNACNRSLQMVSAAVYRCFRTANGLGQPGNHKLFQLIVACRGRLGIALHSFLAESIATQPHRSSDPDPTMFSGVYFTASGEKPTQQGFSQQVLARMMDQQEFLSWTSQRKSQEHVFRLTSWILIGVCVALLLILIGQLVAALTA